MKRFIISLSIISILCIASLPLIDYLGGRLGMYLTIGFLPFEVVPAFIAIICVVMLLISFDIAIIKNKKVIPFAALGLVFIIASFFIIQVFPIGMPFLVGFRDRVNSIATPEELRHIAEVAREHVPISKWGGETFTGSRKAFFMG